MDAFVDLAVPAATVGVEALEDDIAATADVSALPQPVMIRVLHASAEKKALCFMDELR